MDIMKQIEKVVEMESIHWKQRARVNWLANGDRNTRAFHIQASQRWKKYTIKRLMDVNGVWMEGEEDKARLTQSHFEELFCLSRPSPAEIDRVVGAIDLRLGTADRDFLSRPLDGKEVRRALFDMHPTKVSGPDGFNAKFFHRLWPLLGDFVTGRVLDILNGEAEVEVWNETLIGLIPKKDEPEVVANFRPISLCNTCYKLGSKVIVNRLRLVLGKVIDQN